MGLEYKIEQLDGISGRLHVTGWVVSTEKRPITWTISTKKGDPVPSAKYYTVQRSDISRLFFETEDYAECGFEIDANMEGEQSMVLKLSDGEQTVTVPLKPHGIGNRLKAEKRLLKIYQENREYRKWYKTHRVTSKELRLQHQTTDGPLITLLLPIYRTPFLYLKQMVESIRSQSYENWQLCLSNTGARDGIVEEYLKVLEQKDPRICLVEEDGQIGISGTLNKALELAKGSYIGWVDHDDLVESDALYCVAQAIRQHPDAGIFYTDEDQITANGRLTFHPKFKPDFDRKLFYTHDYLHHLLVMKRDAIPEEEWFFRSEVDGAQYYDLMLRALQYLKDTQIVHIPRILYHERMHPMAVAARREVRQNSHEAGLRALQDAFSGNPDAYPESGIGTGYYQIRRMEPEEMPETSVVVRNVAHLSDLPVLESEVRSWGNAKFEIIVETERGLNRTPRGEWILFLDAAWVPTFGESFRKMAAILTDPAVGAVTGVCCGTDGDIYNAGVHLEQSAEHLRAVSSFDGYPLEKVSYQNLTKLRHQTFGALAQILLLQGKLYRAMENPLRGRITGEEALEQAAQMGVVAEMLNLKVVCEPEVREYVKDWNIPVRTELESKMPVRDPYVPDAIQQGQDGNWKVNLQKP